MTVFMTFVGSGRKKYIEIRNRLLIYEDDDFSLFSSSFIFRSLFLMGLGLLLDLDFVKTMKIFTYQTSDSS